MSKAEPTPTPTSKPNILLLVGLLGAFFMAVGTGLIKIDDDTKPEPTPAPVPSPVVIPSPTPTPVPNPTPAPTPTPQPVPSPTPTPDPEPPIVLENFPELPPQYAATSAHLTASLFRKETSEDALNYARFYRDISTALRTDETIISNDRFIKVYMQALQSLANSYPGLAQRNVGLGAAIDKALEPIGLDNQNWTVAERNKMADALNSVSYRLLEAYKSLNGYPADEPQEQEPAKDKVA